MAYHHYAAAHVAARAANWAVGVCGASAVISGVYALVFDLPRILPIAFLFLGALAGIVAIGAARRARRGAEIPQRAQRGYGLAGIAGIIAPVSLVLALVPLSGEWGLYALSGLAQAVCAGLAVKSWWGAESVVVASDEGTRGA